MPLSLLVDVATSDPPDTIRTAAPSAAAGGAGNDLSTIELQHDRSVGDASPAAQRRLLDDYELLSVLGRGGMGIVYKARQKSLNRTVAVKMIKDGETPSEHDRQRFYAEAKAAAQLDHPGIVRVLEVGESNDGHLFYSMGFVDGHSLAHELRAGALPPQRAAQLAQKIAMAVDYAHREGVIHRDLKPGNVLIDTAGEPKITDFGLAKRLQSDQQLTVAGQVLGTPNYMPPEQARGEEVDARADVYSLGAVLYALLTGDPPFRAESQHQTLLKVLSETPAPPRTVNPKVPADLERICLKCLHKEQRDRYASAAELADDLGRFLRGEPVAARPIGWFGRGYRRAKRNPLVTSLAAAVALVAIVVGSVAWYYAQSAQQSGREVAQAQAISSLNDEIDRKLAGESWTSARLQELDALVARLTAINDIQGRAAAQRIDDSFRASVAQQLRAPSLASVELRQRIEAHLQLLQSRSPSAAAELEAEYRQRLGRQQTVLHVSATQGEPDKVFSGEAISIGGDALVRDETSTAPIVRTPEPARGDVTLDVQFGRDWDAGKEIGLVLGEQGYRFTLTSSASSNVTLRESRAGNAPLRATIARGALVLRQIDVPLELLTDAGVHLVASRRGSVLRFKVNQQTELEIYDYFAVPAAQQGEFALLWPPPAELQLLLASRQIEPQAPSAMEQGDKLFAAGSFGEAAVFYEQQAAELGDAPAAGEALYKQGLCLAALARPQDAIAVWQRASLDSTQPFAPAAMCELVRHFVQQQQFPEADALLQRLLVDHAATANSNGPTLRLAALIPLDVRSVILGHYMSQAGANYWSYDPEIIARQQVAVALQEQLQDPYVGWTQLNLVRALRFTGDESTALSTASKLLAGYRDGGLVTNDDQSYAMLLTVEVCWMLRLRGQASEALVEVNKTLLDRDGELRPEMFQLLIERARIHADQGRWEEARADLELLLQSPRSERRSAPQDTEAKLLLGFVRERLGLPDAQQMWREASMRPKPPPEAIHFAGGFDIVRTLIAASLAGDFSDAAVDAFVLENVAPAFSLDPLRMRLAMNLVKLGGLRTAMLRDMWLSDRGRASAEDFALQRLSLYDHVTLPARLMAYEALAQTCFDGKPSPDEQALLWDAAERAGRGITGGKIPVTTQLLTAGAMTWAGQSQWETLAKHLEFDPVLRSQGAFCVALRYRRLGKADAAKPLLQAARDDAPEGSLARKLAEQALAQ